MRPPLCAALLGCACGGGATPAARDAAADGPAGARADAADAGRDAVPGDAAPGDLGLEQPPLRTEIGDRCARGQGDPGQGDCTEPGQVCFPSESGWWGGLCSAECPRGDECGAGAECATFGPDQWCVPACAGDEDCRFNYLCVQPVPGDPRGVCQPIQFPTGSADGEGAPCLDPEGVDPGAAPRAFSASATISRGSSETETEVSLAARPDGTLLAAYLSFPPGRGVGVGLSRSGDAGRTWRRVADVADPDNLSQWDPAAAAAPDGAFYVVWAGAFGDAGTPEDAEIRVARSDDGGRTFAIAGTVAACPSCRLDKPWIAVDEAGAVYVSYTRIDNPLGAPRWGMRLARSDDRGATWASDVELFGSRAYLQFFSSLATAGPGVVYLAWTLLGSAYWGDSGNAARLAASEDGGATFSAIDLHAGGEAVAWGQTAIAAAGDDVWAVYPTGGGDGRFGLTLARSRDRGGSVDARARLHEDECATHVMPAIAIAPDGALHLAYADNRHGFGAVWHARVPDAAAGDLAPTGESFVSDAPFFFAFDRAYGAWLGDYLSLALTPSHVHVVWGAERPGEPDDLSHIGYARAPR